MVIESYQEYLQKLAWYSYILVNNYTEEVWEKDGTTRIFVQAGESGKVYEGYPVDDRRDRSKWLPLGVVAARGDIRLTNSTGGTTTTWHIHPVEEGNPLPFPLEENDEFETGAMDVAAAADEMDQWVGRTGLTIITS